jgi:hypothetical protein
MSNKPDPAVMAEVEKNMDLVDGDGEVHNQPFIPPESLATVPPAPVSPPDLAHDQRILDRFKVAIRRRGVVGEETTAATVYLALTSRVTRKPVSIAVKGHSASGKSFTVETVTEFFPPAAFIEMTGMSERALVYMRDDYRHRTIVLYEADALREGTKDNLTSYFVRSLLSEGRIEYRVTVRDKDGNWTSKTIVKEGPTNIVFTTTRTRVHEENETRLLSLSTDDSREQTRRVFLELVNEETDDDDLSEWHDLQEWLQRAEHRVTIPYREALAKSIPPVAIRLRRDVGALLALIRSHAILHQLNRERDDQGRIVASIDDYDVVRGLVAGLLSEGVGATVSQTIRATVETVAELAPEDGTGVPAVAVAAKLNLDKSAARRRLLAASDGDFVRNLEERRGIAGRWVVGEPLPEEKDLLPPPCHLQPRETPGQPQVARWHANLGGVKGPTV